MAQEIERKFLVLGDDYKTVAGKSARIIQGYLSSNPGRTVRVRIKDNKGFITIKGNSNASGTTRFEWEKEIEEEEAAELINICEPGIIDKIRYEVKSGIHTFEVDEFLGDNQGLVVAEVELSGEDEVIVKPFWLGKEVTGDAKYYNSVLSKSPYFKW